MVCINLIRGPLWFKGSDIMVCIDLLWGPSWFSSSDIMVFIDLLLWGPPWYVVQVETDIIASIAASPILIQA